MAQAALIGKRGRREFLLVGVGMAVRAQQGAGLVHGIARLGHVASRALKFGVFGLERERALLVRFARKQRRLEPDLVMTSSAIGSGGAGNELSFMDIFVATRAQAVGDGPVEIAVLVALRAQEFRVPSPQREGGRGVTEVARRLARLPTIGFVTGVTASADLGLLEGSPVGIRVATLATACVQSLVAGGLVWFWLAVALLAGDGLM